MTSSRGGLSDAHAEDGQSPRCLQNGSHALYWDSFPIVLARDSTHTFFCRPLMRFSTRDCDYFVLMNIYTVI